MLSKAKIKLIRSLESKKQRNELKLFVVEGKKQVAELLTSTFEIPYLVCTAEWLEEHQSQIGNYTEVLVATENELYQTSLQHAPQQVLAVVKMPREQFHQEYLQSAFTLMLDGIQDPGNLGTIIRIADWYGIAHITCSPDCVDVFNPKTIQASMGSFLRVQVWYQHLEEVLKKNTLPVYGAVMNGSSLYQSYMSGEGILLIGNEGKGISAPLLPFVTHPVTIPRLGGAESLNAGIATAIICDAWARANK